MAGPSLHLHLQRASKPCNFPLCFQAEARPLKFGNSWSLSSIKSGSLFDIDELYTEAMKTSGGPSPGGKGHSFTTSQTLEGIKNEGPSSGGKGHAFTTSQTLGGIKNGGPSSERKVHAFINSHTVLGLGEIKRTGPSDGGSGN
ncbi:uncharacterized protein LOC121050198 [Rosa chinensis]|uniref:uncharacterized protein LOC121050198 n=1 Tax=Rosa chinensis TaxID=74649 RepID=UPI001AD8D2AB|nr:uncharacterized protein LOC121050198 [Rosa chinensis]